MKLIVAFELDVDEKAWANEYGLDAGEVPEDVRTYLTTTMHDIYPSTSGLVREVTEVSETTHSRGQVSTALNSGADLVSIGLDLGDRDTDLINLIVNAQAHVLDKPDADLDEVIGTNYSESPEEVRSWWDW
ncbi:hypothetical protein AB0E27_31360 [Streptomyces sparsogenes]|uniref:hypothetical protein n=1 Tax=Streptomyces sparsogenes TaxID=67365 RepID=UPI0033DF0BDC